MTGSAQWGYRACLLALALVASALTVRNGLGNFFAVPNPDRAVAIDPSNALALESEAHLKLIVARTADDASEISGLSRKALATSPLAVTALRNLGLMAETRQDLGAADRFMTLAGKMSKRDALSQAWLFDRRFRQGRLNEAIEAADTALRQSETVWEVLMGELIKLVDEPRARERIAVTLAARPYWRSVFMEKLGSSQTSAASVYALLARVKALNGAPMTSELRSYFARVRDSTNPQEVWTQWLALRPQAGAVANIRDGDFSGYDGPPPFVWTYYPNDSAIAEIGTPMAGKNKALYLAYNSGGLVNFANQMLMLPPGHYRLSLRANGDDDIKPDQFQASIRCGGLNANRIIGVLGLQPRVDEWKTYVLDFDVPGDCPAQQLWFSGLALLPRNPSAIWIDDLSVAARPS